MPLWICLSGSVPTPERHGSHRVEPADSAIGGAEPTSASGREVLSPTGRRGITGRLARIAFLVAVLLFALYWIVKNRHQVGQAWHQVTFWPVLGAFLANGIAAWSGVPAWRALLAGLGSRLRLRDAQRVFLMGQLGKYIPGGVWTVIAQATMAKELHVPRARSGTAGLMAILLAVIASSILGAACLGIAGHQILGKYWWTLLLVVPLLAALHPGVLVWVGAIAGRITKRSVPLERIPERTLLTAAGWLFVGQVCNGVAFYLLVDSISVAHTNPLLPIGLFALAAAIGVVIVFLPAGVGAREVILAFGLSTITDAGSAALIVLMSRVVLTLADVVLAGAAAGIGRRRPRTDIPS